MDEIAVDRNKAVAGADAGLGGGGAGGDKIDENGHFYSPNRLMWGGAAGAE